MNFTMNDTKLIKTKPITLEGILKEFAETFPTYEMDIEIKIYDGKFKVLVNCQGLVTCGFVDFNNLERNSLEELMCELKFTIEHKDDSVIEKDYEPNSNFI